MGPAARFLRPPGARRNRRRGVPVLVAGRPVDRVFRQGQAEENRCCRRTGSRPLRRAVAPRWDMETEQGRLSFLRALGNTSIRSPAAAATPCLTLRVRIERVFWPSFLPDGHHFVSLGRREKPGVYVASLDPDFQTSSRRRVICGAAYASDGYLMLGKGGAMADPVRSAVRSGWPRPDRRSRSACRTCPVLPDLGLADFSVSRNGGLIHGILPRSTSLVWFDRAGNPIASVPGATGYQSPPSPDEKWIAAHRSGPESPITGRLAHRQHPRRGVPAHLESRTRQHGALVTGRPAHPVWIDP